MQREALQLLDVFLAGEGVGQQPGVLLEDLLRPAVGQAGPACLLSYVQRRGARGRLAAGEEERAAGASGDQPGQQLGGAGLPVNPLGRPALRCDLAALVLRVQVFHVQAQHLVGSGRRFIEHLPERLVSQPGVQPPQGGDLVLGEGLGAVGRCRPLDADRRVTTDPVLALPPADRLARDRQLPVDGVGVPLVRSRRRQLGQYLRQRRVGSRECAIRRRFRSGWPQPTAFLTSALMRCSSAAVSSCRA